MTLLLVPRILRLVRLPDHAAPSRRRIGLKPKGELGFAISGLPCKGYRLWRASPLSESGVVSSPLYAQNGPATLVVVGYLDRLARCPDTWLHPGCLPFRSDTHLATVNGHRAIRRVYFFTSRLKSQAHRPFHQQHVF